MIRRSVVICFFLWLNGGHYSIQASTSRRSLNTIDNLLQSLDAVKSEIDSNLFLYQTPDFQWIPSTVYHFDDFRESLNIMSTEGVAGKTFYIGEDVQNGHVYGLVNIAAFLAQSMKETIQYDACDENSWDLVNGKYPLSNACGQLGQSYQDYHCSEEEKHMECPVDPNMSITAVTHAKWYGAPGPLFCGPKTEEQPFSGYWDYTYECNKAWANPPETCDVYEDQKAGRYDQSVAVANTAGRTDVEGCCWWGRGVIQTSGVCPVTTPSDSAVIDGSTDGVSQSFSDTPKPTRQPVSPSSDVGIIVSSSPYIDLERALEASKDAIDNDLFLYQTPDFQWIPSTVYRYADFFESLYIMSTEGVAGKTFYIGEDVQNGHVYGLVNIAAFLAQSMKETIQYDACDENSWDLVNGKYPLSNACGQLGQSYQDYHCSEEEKHMECPVDPNMSITAVTHAKWYGAPGPLFCGPKTEEQPFSGYWDYTYECNKAWANPPETCDVYEDQKAGRYDQSVAVANTAGRTDVEGCCWWGRGVIQTSGVCNFGKLNYFLGAGAAKDGRTSRYPNIDFCKDPEVICNSPEYKELKWIAGMFYWIESVQSYNNEGWDYLTELRAFVEGGMSDTSFIDGVSGIVNRGCHNPPCGTGALDGGLERSANFKKALEAFFDGSTPEISSPVTTPSDSAVIDGSTDGVSQSFSDTPKPTRQPVSPSSDVGIIVSSSPYIDLERALEASKDAIDNDLFLYQTPDFQWIPSTVYRYADFFESLYIMSTEGVAGKTFYIGEDVQNGHVYGLVNIAAFLAQSMKETIQYDACDENSWDLVNGKYPLSNACGQLGQSYQDYHCSEEEKHMECPVDPNMSITAVTHAKWYGAPGPLFCGPKTEEQPFSGYWDYTYECNKAWANPPETCDVYEDQKAGRYDQSVAVANTAGRTDVEGCCWWGRGVIQTSGVCNFGKLNYFLGAGAAKDGRTSRYPNIDFCKDPEVICNSPEYKELKWIAGMFYWIESVQSYNNEGWDYLTELRAFVEGGMSDTSFIDGVSGIVNRGCHNPPCGTGALDGGLERSTNFKKALEAFFGSSLPDLPMNESGTSVSTSSTTSFGSFASSETVSTIAYGGSSVDSGSGLSISESTPGLTDLGTSVGSSPSGSGVYYPDYNPIWSLGKCINDSPPPSGRPNYDSLIDCCEKAYGGQASGACLSAMSANTFSVEPSLDSPLTQASETPGDGGEQSSTLWYPDYNAIWALGKCISILPFPNGRPTYDTQLDCCQNAYRGQASGECLANISGNPMSVPNLPQTGNAESLPSDSWYADFNPQWALGKCINESPVPANRPWYTTQSECCEKAYGGQASGACLEGTRDIVSIQSDGSFANAFTSYLQSRKYGDFIVYTCNPLPEIPPNSGTLDISYDYEYSVPQTIRADLVLPDLKVRMMGHLAERFGCESTVQRNLRQANGDDVLLGFQSAEGSDEIDTKKAYCKLPDDEDAAAFACVPVKGHLVAFIQQDTPREVVELIKNKILESLADGQYTSEAIHKVVYIGEPHANLYASHADTTVESATHGAAWISVLASLLSIIAIVLIALFFVIRRKNAMQIREVYQDKENSIEEEAGNGHTSRTSIAGQSMVFAARKHAEYYEVEDNDDSLGEKSSSGSDALEKYDRGRHSIVLSNLDFKGDPDALDIANMPRPDRSSLDEEYENGGVNFVLSNSSPYSCVLPTVEHQSGVETESDNDSVEHCRYDDL
eukprot:CCRYP_005704-RA/>CCRYP_005704-RA protein AED:0.09 eAED:0.09 QI:0/0.84/0.78/1/0.92/0.85/14/873/1725